MANIIDKRCIKSATRLYVVQALFQMEASQQSMQEVRQQFITHRFGGVIEGVKMPPANIILFESLLNITIEQQAFIDQTTNRALVAHWPIERIDPLLRAIFRAACAEIINGTTPVKVVINEYLMIAKAFSSDEHQTKFVNAVLDSTARSILPKAFATL